MSMNNNSLEIKMNELTDVIKGLSNRPMLTSNDVNNLLNNLTKRFENVSIEGFENLGDDIKEVIINVLNDKHRQVEEKLSAFENFVNSAEQTIKNPKMESEITRILNDIEALYAKMNNQETQAVELKKAFETFKDFSNTNQISKLSNDIMSISRSYDGIVEVLNGNFEEFLKRVEALSSNEELRRFRAYLEEIENNQNVLVSAMNSIHNNQEEIKNTINRFSFPQDFARNIDEIQKIILGVSTKSDLDILSDKLNAVMGFLANFKDDSRNIIQEQLSLIEAKVEAIKVNPDKNINEDMVRLYNSMAEFKDNIHNIVAGELKNVFDNLNIQYDKISNSMINSNLDTNDAVNGLTNEVKKLNNSMTDVISSNKEELLSSVKEEFKNIALELYSLKSNDSTLQLARNIESLRNSLDFDSVSKQIEQIKLYLNNIPTTNKDELLNSINDKIDILSRIINSKTVSGQAVNFESADIKEKTEAIYNEIGSIRQILSNIEPASDIKEKIEQLGDIIKNISKNPMLEQFEAFRDNILSAGVNNINEIKDLITEFDRGLLVNIEVLKSQILEIQGNEPKHDPVIPIIGKFEARLHEKLVTLGAIVEQRGNSNREKLQGVILQNLETIRSEIKNISANISDELLNSKFDSLSEFIKNQWSETKIEFTNYLKQETEIITSILSERDENRENETITKIGELIKAQEASDSRLSHIKEVTGALGEILANTNRLQAIDEIKQEINAFSSKLGEIKTPDFSFLEEFRGNNETIKNILENQNSKINEIISLVDKNSHEPADFSVPVIQNLEDTKEKITIALNDVNKNIEDKFNALNQNNETINSKIGDLISQNKAELQNSLNELNEGINKNHSLVTNSIVETNTNLENALERITERIDAVNSKFEQEPENPDFMPLLEEIKNEIENFKTVQNKDLLNAFDSIKEKFNEVKSATEEVSGWHAGEIKAKIEALSNSVQNDELKNIINELKNVIESKNSEEIAQNLQKNLEEIIKVNTNNAPIISELGNFVEIFRNILIEKGNENSGQLNDIKRFLSLIEEKLEVSLKSKDEILPEVQNSFEEKTANLSEKLEEIEKNIQISIQNNIEEKINGVHLNIDNTKELIEGAKETLQTIKNGLLEENSPELENKIGEKIAMAADETNKNIEDKFNALNQNNETINSKIGDLISQNKAELQNSLNELNEDISRNHSLVTNSIVETNTNLENALERITERVDALNSKIAEQPENPDIMPLLEEIKNEIYSLLGIAESQNPANETREIIRALSEKIDGLSENDNTKEFELVLEDKISSLEAQIDKVTGQIQSSANGVAINIKDTIDDICAHIHTNINGARETLDELKGSDNEIKGLIETIKDNQTGAKEALSSLQNSQNNANETLYAAKEAIYDVRDNQNSAKEALESVLGNQSAAKALLETVREGQNAAKEALDSVLGSQNEAKAVLEAVRDNQNTAKETIYNINEAQTGAKEALYKINEAQENAKELLNNIKSSQEALNEAQEGTKEELRNLALNARGVFEAVQNNTKETLDTVKNSQEGVKEGIEAIQNNQNEARGVLETVREGQNSAREVLYGAKEALDNVFGNQNFIKETLDSVLSNQNAARGVLETVRDNQNSAKETQLEAKDTLYGTKETLDTVRNNQKEARETLDILKDSQNSTLETLYAVQAEAKEAFYNIKNNQNNTIETLSIIKENVSDSKEIIINELKEELQNFKNAVAEQLSDNEDDTSVLNKITSIVEEKIQQKMSLLENLIEESTRRFDNKTLSALGSNVEAYSSKLDEKINYIVDELHSKVSGIQQIVDDKAYEIVSKNSDVIKEVQQIVVDRVYEIISKNNDTIKEVQQIVDKNNNIIKNELTSKVSGIQQIVDDKVYQIVNKNNDIIKDELKLRAEKQLKEISTKIDDKIGKIESYFSRANDGEIGQNIYTMADVEADIEQIRIGIEKSNKLSNFKEFASRLVELKNINLENAKMSRVIGSDIVRFDSWLKNVTAKIEAISLKMDKSEKMRMEEIKTRLIQNEKSQEIPQKLEDAIISIYKKQKAQETRLEEISVKMDTLSQRQEGNFNSKEFIDICYENTQQTKSLADKIDAMEAKMELIQSKIDYIISSCINEE